MKKTYKEYKSACSDELNDFAEQNCIWAFGKEQLTEALKKLNLTEAEFQEKYTGFFGGGAILKDKVQAYLDLCKKQNDELQELLKDPEFCYEALYYELANHEFGYTGDETPALIVLGLTAEDICSNKVLNEAYCRAVSDIKNSDY